MSKELSEIRLEGRIFTFRSVQVMIDRDLAEMYQVQTKVLNQAVKRNIDRFLIIDEIDLYHIGASLKDLGKRWFAFSQMNAETLRILQNLKRIKA